MFRCGAHTIALGKHDEILDPYTEYVTDTVERDGVAKAMEHYGLILTEKEKKAKGRI